MMKKALLVVLSATVGAIGLAACDATPPAETAAPEPAEAETIVPIAESVEPEPGGTDAEAVDAEAIAAARAALVAAIRDEDAYSRARRLGTLLPTLGPEAVPAVLQTLEDRTLDLGGLEIELLVRFWATHRPVDASRWAVTQSPKGYKVGAILNSITVWAELDPEGAMEGVQRAAQGWAAYGTDVYQTVQVAVVRGWFAAGHSELKPFIQQIGAGVGRQRALATFVRALVQKQGAEAAIRWAEALPDDDAVYKTAVYRRVATVLARFDREAAMRWCRAHCEGPYGDNLRSIIATQWVRSDGAAALEWLGREGPAGHETNLAVRFTFSDWGLADREAALAWMATQTTGTRELEPWLQPVIPVYARLLAQESPDEAIAWAEGLDHDATREATLARVAQIWRANDAEAAEAWLAQSPLSEEARDRARGKPPAPPEPIVPEDSPGT